MKSMKPTIVMNNLYLGIEGNKTNFDNMKAYLDKLAGKDSTNAISKSGMNSNVYLSFYHGS